MLGGLIGNSTVSLNRQKIPTISQTESNKTFEVMSLI
jgi:hypothetical protein